MVSTTSTNLEVELAPRNQNHQRVPRRKKCEKLQGQRSQSLKLTTLSTNWKIEKRNRLRRNSRVQKWKAAAQAKKAKKTVTEDDDDNRLDDLIIVERKVPDIEEYDDDDDRDDDYEPDEEDDDDFEIPPLRARKPTQSDKSTDKSKKAKLSDAALEDLADFVE